MFQAVCQATLAFAHLSEDSVLCSHTKISRLCLGFTTHHHHSKSHILHNQILNVHVDCAPYSTPTESLLYTKFQEFGCHLLIFDNLPTSLSKYLFYYKNKLKRVFYTGWLQTRLALRKQTTLLSTCEVSSKLRRHEVERASREGEVWNHLTGGANQMNTDTPSPCS